jgi:ribose 5-phosphate isomerase A
MDSAQRLRLIGERAAQLVQQGDLVGLGTGSTVDALLFALGQRVAEGLEFTGVATSVRTKQLANDYGIPLLELNDVGSLDLCIDGADEIDPRLNLVKGRGGALLYEKLVAERAGRLIVIASAEKLVDRLGTRLPLPVEVIPFGYIHTQRAVGALGLIPILRVNTDGSIFVTDGGHYILDCQSQGIDDPAALAAALKGLTGVVDHGLFIGLANLAITVDDHGVIADHTVAAHVSNQ